MSPTLSICIPTWNRDVYLESLLARVDAEVAACRSDAEIVVSDNASTDRTREVAMRYASRPNFRYIRRERNEGAVRNFLDVVAAASGKYCWLFGDDDILVPGAVAMILRVLADRAPDLLLFSSANLRFVDETIEFDRLHDFVEHFAKTRPRTLLDVTLITGMVFRRALWMLVPDKERLIPTQYLHSIVVAEGLLDGGRIVVVPGVAYAVPERRAPMDWGIQIEIRYLHLQYLMTLAWLSGSGTLKRFVRRERFRVLRSTAGDVMRLTKRHLKNVGLLARTARRALFARGDAFSREKNRA